MTLIEHVKNVSGLYKQLEETESLIDNVDTALGRARTSMILSMTLPLGTFPVIQSQDFTGIDTIDVSLDYVQGDNLPKFNFVERNIPNWGSGYFKEPSSKPDEPVSTKISIQPARTRTTITKEDYLQFGNQLFSGSDKNNLTVRQFYYFLGVCQFGKPDREHQDIASEGYGSEYICNQACHGSNLYFHVRESMNWSPEKKMKHISEALRIFFKEKGYNTQFVDLGELHKESVKHGRILKDSAQEAFESLEKKLEEENILELTDYDSLNLLGYFDAFRRVVSKYDELKQKNGRVLDLSPMEDPVRDIPVWNSNVLSDLLAYTNGLKRAVTEDNLKQAQKKFVMIFRELASLDAKISGISEQNKNPEGAEQMIISLFGNTSQIKKLPMKK